MVYAKSTILIMIQSSANTYQLTFNCDVQLNVVFNKNSIKIKYKQQEFNLNLQNDSPQTDDLKIQIDKSLQYFNSISPQNTPQKHVLKGLLCSNRECFRIVKNKRSAYCSQGCQIREQNLRQKRVAVRKHLQEKKQIILTQIQQLEGVFNINDINKIISNTETD